MFLVAFEYIVPLFFSLLMAFELKSILKMKIEIAIPFGYMTLTIMVYLVYISGFIVPIRYLMILFLVMPIILLFIKRKQFKIKIDKNDIKALCSFVFLYSAVFIFDYNRGFTHWDEMSHWGPMVKETLRLDQLYSVDASKLGFHKDYPPIKALFESVWCNLSGGYAEKNIYRALHIIIVTMLFAMTTQPKEYFKKEKIFDWIKYLILTIPFIAVCAVFTLDDGNIFTTIYADGIMAITAAFCIYLILTLHEYTWIEISVQTIALSFLMLIKQIGFEYYMLCLLLFLCIFFIDWKGGRSKTDILKKGICILAIPVAFKGSWSAYVNIHELNGQFDLSKIDLNVIRAIVFGNDRTSWCYTGTVGYVEALFKKPLFYVGEYGVSYLAMFLVGLAIYLFLFFCNRKKKNYNLGLMLIVYNVGIIGHAVMMWITYMFCYYPGDFLNLACYERYMNVIWVVNGIIILFLGLQTLCNSVGEKWTVVLAAGVSVVMIIASDSEESLIPSIKNNSSLIEYYDEADYINENTEEDSSVFIVSQGDNGYALSVFRYLTMPRTYNNDDYSFGEQYSEGDIWTRNYSKQEFFDIVKSYDYVFFYNVDKQFVEGYGDVFKDDNSILIENERLYKIDIVDDKGMKLTLIEV